MRACNLRLGYIWRFVSTVVSLDSRVKFGRLHGVRVDVARVREAVHVTPGTVGRVDVCLGLEDGVAQTPRKLHAIHSIPAHFCSLSLC